MFQNIQSGTPPIWLAGWSYMDCFQSVGGKAVHTKSTTDFSSNNGHSNAKSFLQNWKSVGERWSLTDKTIVSDGSDSNQWQPSWIPNEPLTLVDYHNHHDHNSNDDSLGKCSKTPVTENVCLGGTPPPSLPPLVLLVYPRSEVHPSHPILLIAPWCNIRIRRHYFFLLWNDIHKNYDHFSWNYLSLKELLSLLLIKKVAFVFEVLVTLDVNTWLMYQNWSVRFYSFFVSLRS